MTDTFSDDVWAGISEPIRESPPSPTFREKIKRVAIGKTATHCAFCGEEVLDEIGYRVAAFQVYCSEEHAVADQENNPL